MTNNKKNNSLLSDLFYNKQMIIYLLICILITLLLIAFNYYRSDYNYLKKKIYKPLVYTKYKKSNNKEVLVQVPTINIRNKIVEKINNEIASDLEKFLKKDNNKVTYEWELNGKVLSLVIEKVDNNTLYTPEIKFKTYNINIEEGVILSDSDLLNIYSISREEISKKIESQFMDHYKKELDEGYFDEHECNYECYLGWRNIDNYLDNVEYYIHDKNLYVYKEFSVYSVYGEERYFTDDDFLIFITEKE